MRSDAKSENEANRDYMAGFQAGVRATEREQELHNEAEPRTYVFSDEEDEEYIMRKGRPLNFYL